MGSIASAAIAPPSGPILVQELIPPSAVILLVTSKAPRRIPRLTKRHSLRRIFILPDQNDFSRCPGLAGLIPMQVMKRTHSWGLSQIVVSFCRRGTIGAKRCSPVHGV